MNQAQFYCQLIKRLCNNKSLLPSEYQQVEYLEGTPSRKQYIVTSVPLTSAYYLEVRYMLVNSNKLGLFGSLTTAYPIGSFNTYNGRLIISSNRNAILPTNNDVIYNLIAYYDAQTSACHAFIDGAETSYMGDSGNTANNGFSLFISNWPTSGDTTTGRIYHAMIKDSIDGAPTLDLYPCYRISDNKPGMYDLVTNIFYTNAGTGEFTVGDRQ